MEKANHLTTTSKYADQVDNNDVSPLQVPVKQKTKRRSVYESKAPEDLTAAIAALSQPQHPTASVLAAAAPGPEAASPVLHSGAKAAWGSLKTGLVKRKPHQGHCKNYAALQAVVKRDGMIGLHHFETIRRMGDGDLGVVDLVALKGTDVKFAMKVIDKGDIERRNKVNRVYTESHILQNLDHPYCATLHCTISTPSHLHLVMESCGGGDLYSLMDAQPGNRLSEEATLFYAAEVLLALQYMHLQGFVYRDLKPENLLIGCDGHIVVTDFDLSYTQGVVKPRVEFARRNVPAITAAPKKKKRKAKGRADDYVVVPVVMAEPTMKAESLVGTEEYISPEIISVGAYNSAVDWWSFGILIYEMLFGRTPFHGVTREDTFDNILSSALTFPSNIPVSKECQELIQGLLTRNPSKRLGSNGGAEEIKSHPFFRNINWALLRNQHPPFVPRPGMQESPWGEQIPNG